MKTITAFLVVALLPACAFAQRREPPVGARMIGSFGVGVHHIDVTDFNNALTSNYQEIKSNVLAVAGSGFTVRRRLLFGGEGTALLTQRHQTSDGKYYTRFMGGYGAFDLGYAAVDRKGWLLYPMLGLGIGGVQYSIQPLNGTTFSNVLSNPARGSHMSAMSMVIPLRVGLVHDFPGKEKRGVVKGPSVGVRVGYVFAPLQGKWHGAENVEVTGGPKVTVAGPQVLVTVGGWNVK